MEEKINKLHLLARP